MTRFDATVLTPEPVARAALLGWLEAALAAVEPERLTAEALAGRARDRAAVIAIGKAAPGMSRGAASMLEVVGGVCVTDHPDAVPDAMTVVVGDHPIPGPASLAAGESVLEAARSIPSSTEIVALISGGGSALCEAPRPGVPAEFLSAVSRRLVSSGADIEDMNLVRSHLSAIKCGGVARAAGRPIDTLLVSDVGGAAPGVVASGPTIPGRHDPEAAMAILKTMAIDIPAGVPEAIYVQWAPLPAPRVTMLADGRDAARGLACVAPSPVMVDDRWLRGPVESCLDRFLAWAGAGVTVGAGEVTVDVTVDGAGGRNTHAALLAAERLAGSGDIFCAFATDGVDGGSGAAGAVVDGSTLDRGGDPTAAKRGFDSASYLARTSDLLLCPPTGTNVSDLWILWRRG